MAPTDRGGTRTDSLYFDVQADVGISKHMGGCRATQALARMCRIRAGQHVLEVGCGVGTTAVALASNLGCRVTALDVSSGMAARAAQTVRRRGLKHLIHVVNADVGDLPFAANSFDVVLAESVFAFVPDATTAVRECVRVVRPGGFVGANEVTWIRPPSAELEHYAALVMAGAAFLPAQRWSDLLIAGGLEQLDVQTGRFDRTRQLIDEIREFQPQERWRAWGRFIKQTVLDPDFRELWRRVLSSPRSILALVDHIGYGLYVGRKPV